MLRAALAYYNFRAAQTLWFGRQNKAPNYSGRLVTTVRTIDISQTLAGLEKLMPAEDSRGFFVTESISNGAGALREFAEGEIAPHVMEWDKLRIFR